MPGPSCVQGSGEPQAYGDVLLFVGDGPPLAE